MDRKRINLDITIKNSNSFNLLRSSLPHVKIEKTQTDVGPVFNWNENKVDSEKTFQLFKEWIDHEQK